MPKIILTEKQCHTLINKINEEKIDLTNYEASFSSEDFINWVDSEFDLEILKIAKSKIEERINFLNTMIGIGTRNTIKGYRR
jgi:hypothetical protein